MTAPRLGITGANGILGNALREHATDVEWVPYCGDIRDEALIRRWYRDNGPLDGMIHLAAIVPVDKVAADPVAAFQINVGGTLNLLETIRTSGPDGTARPWTFIASTCHVYAPSPDPLTESAPIAPVTLYGHTKLQAEQWGNVFRETFAIPVCIGRIFSFTDPRQADNFFVPAAVAKLRTAPPGATLDQAGLAGLRDFISTEQICAAIEVLWHHRATGTYNIASGHAVRLGDVVHMLKQRLGRNDVTINFAADEGYSLYANVEKLASLGWIPKSQISHIVRQMTTRFLDKEAR